MSIDVALRLAGEADLDLVEVAPEAKPPVAKIMDYGKFKYEAAQKLKEARRNQANTILKEVRFRLKIDVHDYETKKKRAIGFLNDGDKVKAMILFRGREQSRPEQGVRLLQKFAEEVASFQVAHRSEVAPRLWSRWVITVPKAVLRFPVSVSTVVCVGTDSAELIINSRSARTGVSNR